jgi:hypothetical protein
VKTVTKWKFETWNEPDLAGYNLLNFTEKGLLWEMGGLKTKENTINIIYIN